MPPVEEAAPPVLPVEAPPIEGGGDPDPFQVDEASLATLAPEQRQAIDPLISNWKKSAQDAIKKERETVSKKYASYDDYEKKAQALDQLSNDPRFVQWYRQQQTPQQAPQQQAVATPEEWAQAVQEAAAGSPEKLYAIQQKQFIAWAQPTVNQITAEQRQMKAEREADSLFRRHPDADELNRLGVEKAGDPSLLEMAVREIVDKRNGSWEQAYGYARKIADSIRTKGRQEAVGIIKDKKDSVSEGALKSSKDTETVIEVDSDKEAMRKNIQAAMKGENVTYVSKTKAFR